MSVNLRGSRCANFQYICVTIDRDPGSDPFFTLIGVPEDSNAPEVVARTACIEVTCAGQQYSVLRSLREQGRREARNRDYFRSGGKQGREVGKKWSEVLRERWKGSAWKREQRSEEMKWIKAIG